MRTYTQKQLSALPMNWGLYVLRGAICRHDRLGSLGFTLVHIGRLGPEQNITLEDTLKRQWSTLHIWVEAVYLLKGAICRQETLDSVGFRLVQETALALSRSSLQKNL